METTMSKATQFLEEMLDDEDVTYEHRLEAARLLTNFEAGQRALDIEQQRANAAWNQIDRGLRLNEAQQRASTSEAEVDRLAKYITQEYPRYIGDGSAVDVAIKIIDEQERELNAK